VPDPLLIISSEQTLLYVNRAAEELLGELYFGMAIGPVLRFAGLEEQWWRALGRFDERRIELKGQPYDASAVPFRFAGEAETSTILTLHNAADEEELRRLATQDALTGIYNMRHFQSVLDQHLREGGTLALLDLDHFKAVNDELGHAAGDVALLTFTNVIRSELRANDVFARVGGDEFAVFFPVTPVSGAVQIIEAIYGRMSRTPFRYDGVARSFTASSGIAAASEADSVDALKRRADDALYEAKRQGRGRWVVAGGYAARNTRASSSVSGSE
jgi:diguanylate cyclase (GGDEF)-like protein